MAVRTTTDPQGDSWTVRRRWVQRRLRWRGKGGRSIDLMDGSELASLGAELPVVGVIFAVVALLLFAIAAVVLIVPAVVFVVELVLVVSLVGLGVFGRVLLGRPWTVEARVQDADYAYEWKTYGWQASGELRESVAQQLQATGLPAGGTRVPPAVAG